MTTCVSCSGNVRVFGYRGYPKSKWGYYITYSIWTISHADTDSTVLCIRTSLSCEGSLCDCHLGKSFPLELDTTNSRELGKWYALKSLSYALGFNHKLMRTDLRKCPWWRKYQSNIRKFRTFKPMNIFTFGLPKGWDNLFRCISLFQVLSTKMINICWLNVWAGFRG